MNYVKRIVIDARMMGKQQATGIGNYIYQLASRIPQLDPDNEYVFIVSQKNKDLLAPQNNTRQIISDCGWYSWCEQTSLNKQIRRLNPDLVHFPQFNVPVRYTRPFVTTIHDITPLKFPGPNQTKWHRKLAFRMVFRHALQESAAIITVSEYTKNQLVALFNTPKNKVAVTHLGVEKQYKVSQNYDTIEAVRRRYDINKPYVFFAGVWRDHKNVHGLIKAFAILKIKYGLDYQLVLGGEQDDRFPQALTELGSLDEDTRRDVIAPGFIADDDMAPLYQGALAYVVPSFEEGFGLNGLEAMAMKVPVAASQRASLPEVYGNAAVYFNPDDPADMARVIAELVSDTDMRERLISAGLTRLESYSWDKTAEHTLSIYKTILKP